MRPPLERTLGAEQFGQLESEGAARPIERAMVVAEQALKDIAAHQAD